MIRRIILLSGPIGAGKSALGTSLARRYEFEYVKTHELIQAVSEQPLGRAEFQKAGASLDRKTKGAWVATAIAERSFPNSSTVIVDAVRIQTQISAIRRAFGDTAQVVHIHVTAPDDVLAARYAARPAAFAELKSYDEVKNDATEKKARKLGRAADIVLETVHNTEADVRARAAGMLGLYGRTVEPLVDILIGGQYGSEGKGHVASFLAPDYDVLVRVGGPNAGHVVYEEPDPFTHHHLPCGTRSTQAKLIIGPGAVIRPPKLLEEIAKCKVDVERLSIDPCAMVIEDSDIQFEERTLKKSIASTAQGVGAATARKILRHKAPEPFVSVRLAGELEDLKPFIRPTREMLDDAYAKGHRILLEGTQGTGLSIHHGLYPHVTSRDTTASGCLAEAGIASSRVRKIVMVCRTFPIRVGDPTHGTSGAMSHEIELADIAAQSGIPLDELERKERTSTTKRPRRIGRFDWDLLRKSATLNGPTDIALTFADYISIKNRKARRFSQLTSETRELVEEIERVAAAPVSLITTRFDYRSIIDRRAW